MFFSAGQFLRCGRLAAHGRADSVQCPASQGASLDLFPRIGSQEDPLSGVCGRGRHAGTLQYVPYFAHKGWLTTTFLPREIRYDGAALLDYLTGRTGAYAVYLLITIAPLFLVRDWQVRVFGVLVSVVFVLTYMFCSFAYISVLRWGAAVMSLYLAWVTSRRPPRWTDFVQLAAEWPKLRSGRV